MLVRKLILSRLKYVHEEKSVGYSLQEILEGNHLGLSLIIDGTLVEGHYILQIHTNPPSPPFGVCHTREEAENRSYQVALREGASLAKSRGLSLEDQTVQTTLTSI